MGSGISKDFLSVLFINPLLLNLYKKCFTFLNGKLLFSAPTLSVVSEILKSVFASEEKWRICDLKHIYAYKLI